MSSFTQNQLAYLISERRLARIAIVGKDGMPHVTPVGWSYSAEHDTIEVGGNDLTSTRKYRDVVRSGLAAIVIDDVLPPWQPRGVEVRGRAEAVPEADSLLRIHPDHIVSWGSARSRGRRI
jgi:pyridoxamine 5'-phosphate oxidase family protein